MDRGNKKVIGLHHIGVTVNDAAKVVEEWREAFGFEGKVVELPEANMRIGVVKVGGVTFFLNDHDDPEWKEWSVRGLTLPVDFSGHKVVNEAGEGISHIAFETTDLVYVVNRARMAGMRFQREEPLDALEGICNHLDADCAHLPLEFMQPVEGRPNPLEED
jgi:4-hydroxyphenylpyruvate dioxygenase-like putative hemolysin